MGGELIAETGEWPLPFFHVLWIVSSTAAVLLCRIPYSLCAVYGARVLLCAALGGIFVMPCLDSLETRLPPTLCAWPIFVR